MMLAAQQRVRRVVELAERVELDIGQRQLKPGDRYLSTAETAKMLRVDTAIANRALQLLAKRNVITRRQRAGTFVARADGPQNATTLGRVHLVMNDRYPQIEGWLNTDTVLGLQSELPGVQIQFHVVPSLDEKDYLERMIHEALRSQRGEGFVLIHSTLTAQRLITASGLPAVVFGRPYASVEGLAFIDRDQRQIGRLLARHLVEAGHRWIVLLMRQRVLPGDHAMIDGAREELAAAGLSAQALVVRCLPEDSQEVRHVLTGLLERADELPGVLARPALMADAAMEAVELLGLLPQQDVAIVAADYFHDTAGAPYPVIRPALECDQQGARLGRMVARLARGEKPNPENRLNPVRLDVPTHNRTTAQAAGRGGTGAGDSRKRQS